MPPSPGLVSKVGEMTEYATLILHTFLSARQSKGCKNFNGATRELLWSGTNYLYELL